jgi:hypothetical protein
VAKKAAEARAALILSFQVEDNRKNRRKEADELEAEEQRLASIKHRRASAITKGDRRARHHSAAA